ncbi:MAG: hypothetical protein BGO12_02370 [Verrucomicrobia bacterium 61-8]|nr:MAG: hypothetical protein BGO12_02370 [Verrucomicrobia bacterium 61-8]
MVDISSMSIANLDLEELRRQSAEFESATLPEILGWCWDRFGMRAAIGTSFQGAGLVAMDVAYAHGYRFPVFTVDTGLLFPETLELKAKIEDRLGITIESLQPEQTLDQQAAELGPELWNRKPDLCCTLRKVVPLQAKLATLDVWITGLRRQQSDVRQKTQIIEVYNFDVLRDRHIVKLNPMATWSRDTVQSYLREHQIPSNALTARGFRSIGCVPCTRPISEGENERAGRWTGFEKTECGIHTFLGESI